MAKKVPLFKRITRFITLLAALFFCNADAGYEFNKLIRLAYQRYGEDASKHVLAFNHLITSLKLASDSEKLKQVNDFFNLRIKFIDDVELWGQSDYWATPLETMGKGAGDCEDFSIAKYIALKLLNVPNDKIRLTYVRALVIDPDNTTVRAHMVVSYYATPTTEPLILDNLNPEIITASKRTDLTPIFSFNNNALWVGSNSNPKGESQSHLSKWREVLLRIQLDGME